MPPMFVVNKRINTIKELGKKDNVHKRPPDVTQVSKNNSLKYTIKNVFDIDLHHGPIRV